MFFRKTCVSLLILGIWRCQEQVYTSLRLETLRTTAFMAKAAASGERTDCTKTDRNRNILANQAFIAYRFFFSLRKQRAEIE